MQNQPQKLSRMELVELVRKICAAEGTEEEQEDMLTLLQSSVPHPEVSDLIYFPPEGDELTPEEIVDRALAYKPIQL
jgi:hypothetical protein